jgi:hypothetical protein
MSSSLRDITESTEAEGRDDTHQSGIAYTRAMHLCRKLEADSKD